MPPIILNLAAALAYVLGGVCMKLSVGLTRPLPGLLVFLCFCTGAALQAIAMRRSEMAVAYIVVLGLEAALALVLGTLLFRDQITAWKLLGVGTVVVGILLLHSGQ